MHCRSDLSDSKIQGADFSNALLDKPMQQVSSAAAFRPFRNAHTS